MTEISTNNGPLDLSLALDPDVLLATLRDQYAHKLERCADLLAGFERFAAATANGIQTDDVQGKAGDFAKQLRDEVKDVEAARDAVKRPVINAGRVIDGFFKREITDQLDAVRAKIVERMNAFLAEKQRQAREEAARVAAELAEQARIAAQAAEQDRSFQVLERAMEAEQAALDAPQPAPVRVTSDLGTTVGSRSTRIWVLDDLNVLIRAVAAGKVPSNVLTVNKPILDAMARDKTQADLPGLRFTTKTSVSLR
jgi:hypothetical protein